MPEVDREGFFRKQVHGNGNAGKRIDGEDIKLLRRLGFQRKPGVAENNVARCRALLEECEPGICDGDDLRIDVVKPERIAGFSVGRESSSAEADHSNSFRTVAAESQRQADAGAPAVVGRWVTIFRKGQILRAMLNRSVKQRTIGK